MERGAGNEVGEREIEKWGKNRELEMKLLIELGFNLGFVSISHFPVPRACFPFTQHPIFSLYVLFFQIQTK